MIGWKTVLLIHILSVGCLVAKSYREKVDEEWANPFEIGSTLPDAEPEQATIQVKKSSTTESSENDLRLLRVVKSFLRALKGSTSRSRDSNLVWKVKMKLSQSEMQLLKSYSEDLSSSTSLRDVEDVLHSAFASFEGIQERPPPSFTYTSFFPSYDPENAILITTFGLLLILSLALFTGIISLSKFFIGFMILCSIWKWLQLRSSKQLDKDMVCTDEGWIAKYIYSSCNNANKDKNINPDLEVNPIQAVIDTFTEVIARPLPIVGDNLGKFFGSFWGQNGFISTLLGYGFILIVIITTISLFIFSLFYFGLPRSGGRGTSERNEERDSSNDDKIRKLENQVHSLLLTISNLREVSIQSMEYNFRIEELKNNTRDVHRSVPLPVKHLPPALEDNPPYKKLKSVEYPCYENKTLDDSIQESEEARGNKVTALSSDLILSPPSNFKNVSEEKSSSPKQEIQKDDDGCSSSPEIKKDAPEPLPQVEDEEDDFEVISKSTPPPERED